MKKNLQKLIYISGEKLERENSFKTMLYLVKKSCAESSVKICLMDHLPRACTEHCPCYHPSL